MIAGTFPSCVSVIEWAEQLREWGAAPEQRLAIYFRRLPAVSFRRGGQGGEGGGGELMRPMRQQHVGHTACLLGSTAAPTNVLAPAAAT